MKLLSNPVLKFALVANVFALALLVAHPAHAATPTFTTNETVANVVVGANTQTAATSSTQANVPETKATRTITVNSVPTVPVTLTIGSCAITITSVVASDVDCSNNTAAIATSTDTTAAAIAARIRTITSLSGPNHGALTIGGSGVTASFTTTGAETSATTVTATLSTGSDFTLTTVNTTGVVAVAQVWTYTPATVEIGDVFTAIINGTTVSFTATVGTVANVTAGLTAQINLSAQAPNVTAVDSVTRIDVTSDTAGTAFTLTTGTTNRAAVAQQEVFTPANVTTDYGYDYGIDINGTSYSAIGVSVKEVVENLNGLLSTNAAVTCTEDDTAITCTSATPGTSFTYATHVDVRNTGGGGHSGGGGGGGGSHSSTSTSSSAGMGSGSTTTTTTTTTGGETSSFARDLKMGVSGADVMALQAYLNAHGFAVAMTGPGSKGNETMLFGALTRAAVIKMQMAAGITPAVGYFGPKTRAYVAAHP